MSATNSFKASFLSLFFLNDAFTGIGDAGGLLPSAADGNFYIALFSQDPGQNGDVTNEATYTGYARVAVPRNDTEWEEVSGIIRNLNAVTFPECTGGSEILPYFGIMSEATGSNMLFSGELVSPAMIASDAEPQISPNELIVRIT